MAGIVCLAVGVSAESSAPERPIVIGLDADMSSASAEAGEAIRRGAELAIQEINRQGGALGRPLRLEVRDHRGNPARGIDNIEELAQIEDLIAVIGGLHTPVILAELDAIHHHRLISLVPWAAGTPVIDNGHQPNYVFRVSVRDEYAGGVLIDHAVDAGLTRPGLLLERTGWGRSNESALNQALSAKGLTPAGTRWVDWGAQSLRRDIESLLDNGADCLILVCNPPEGLVAIKELAALPQARRVPVVSHWGITGGGTKFFKEVRRYLVGVDLVFLQSYSFIAPPFSDRAAAVIRQYADQFGDYRSPSDIFCPSGTAHAYELVHLLAVAIEAAQSTDRATVRDSLETLDDYDGLIRRYAPPFTARRHDALGPEDLQICRYDPLGAIIPLRGEQSNSP